MAITAFLVDEWQGGAALLAWVRHKVQGSNEIWGPTTAHPVGGCRTVGEVGTSAASCAGKPSFAPFGEAPMELEAAGAILVQEDNSVVG